jgi:hypothetical protein
MVRNIVAWSIGIVVAGLYASMVVAAIGNLLLLPQQAASAGLSVSPTGWFWLGFGVLMPVVVFVLALLVGRRTSAGLRLLVLTVGLGVVAAWQLEVLVLVPASSLLSI